MSRKSADNLDLHQNKEFFILIILPSTFCGNQTGINIESTRSRRNELCPGRRMLNKKMNSQKVSARVMAKQAPNARRAGKRRLRRSGWGVFATPSKKAKAPGWDLRLQFSSWASKKNKPIFFFQLP
ncbi:MAG: hypothetical protein SCH71_11960 [Desulfobulbaceae bacterium]|nr:hypothetical protein [Desulfobulbaceae bacterium]